MLTQCKTNSKNKHESCDAIEDWYNAHGNITRECGLGNTGFFYDAHRQMAWYVHNRLPVSSALGEILTFYSIIRGFETYQDKSFCDNVRWAK